MLSKRFILIVILSLFFAEMSQANFFSKKIKVTKCYEFNSFSSFEQFYDYQISRRIQGAQAILTKWDWELDLKKNTAKRITEIDGIVDINQFKLINTDEYLFVEQTGVFKVSFNKKTEKVTSFVKGAIDIKTEMQCVFK